MNRRLYIVTTMLLLFMTGAWADDYNPPNPPDPLTKFKITVSSSPSGAGYVSGGGSYLPGTAVTLSTSPRQNYEFQYWTCDGVHISDNTSFSYVMTDRPVEMVAVYSFNPSNPADPTTPNKYRLYVDTNLEGSCTFNFVSGTKQSADQYIQVRAQNITPGYKFQGWYAGGIKVSDATSFYYLMPYQDITLTAHFVYDPDNPSDPNSDGSQTSVDTGKLGDVNNDGLVNVSDAVLIISHYLNGTTNELPMALADVNHDSVINISDAVEVINRYLNNQ